jgi:hypothetical protein
VNLTCSNAHFREIKKTVDMFIHKINTQVLKLYTKPPTFTPSLTNSPHCTTPSQSTTVVNNYYDHHAFPMYPYYSFYNPTPTITYNINNGQSASNANSFSQFDESTTKTNSDNSTTSSGDDKEAVQYFLGGLIIAGISMISGAYLLATDEHRKISSINLDSDIAEIRQLVIKTENSELIKMVVNAEEHYAKWKGKFEKRTYDLMISKGGAALSGVTVGGGWFVGSSMVMFGGGIGLVGSACLFVWKYFGEEDTSCEEKLFEAFFLDILNTRHELERLETACLPPPQNLYPFFNMDGSYSAPPTPTNSNNYSASWNGSSTLS